MLVNSSEGLGAGAVWLHSSWLTVWSTWRCLLPPSRSLSLPSPLPVAAQCPLQHGVLHDVQGGLLPAHLAECACLPLSSYSLLHLFPLWFCPLYWVNGEEGEVWKAPQVGRVTLSWSLESSPISCCAEMRVEPWTVWISFLGRWHLEDFVSWTFFCRWLRVVYQGDHTISLALASDLLLLSQE